MKKQLALVAALMAVGSVSMAISYDQYAADYGNLVLNRSQMNAWTQPWNSTTVSGAGSSWTINIGANTAWGDDGWEEGGAYYTFQVPKGTTVKLAGGNITGNVPTSGAYWGDVMIWGSADNPTATIAGRVAGPVPGHGTNQMPYMTDQQWNASWSSTSLTTADAYAAGFQFYGGDEVSPYDSYLAAVMNYGSNIQNFKNGGVGIEGGEYAGWNQLLYGQPNGDPLTDFLYPDASGRVLKDQVGAFNGIVTTPVGAGDWYYVTVAVKGGYQPAASGSIGVDGLTIFIPEPASLGLLALGAMAFLGRRRK